MLFQLPFLHAYLHQKGNVEVITLRSLTLLVSAVAASSNQINTLQTVSTGNDREYTHHNSSLNQSYHFLISNPSDCVQKNENRIEKPHHDSPVLNNSFIISRVWFFYSHPSLNPMLCSKHYLCSKSFEFQVDRIRTNFQLGIPTNCLFFKNHYPHSFCTTM